LRQVGQGQLAELMLVQRAPVATVDEDKQGPAIAAPRKEIQRLQGILAVGQVGQMRMRFRCFPLARKRSKYAWKSAMRRRTLYCSSSASRS
jgi:hypothetical protein